MSVLPSIATAKADSRKRSCLLYPARRFEQFLDALSPSQFEQFHTWWRGLSRGDQERNFGSHQQMNRWRILRGDILATAALLFAGGAFAVVRAYLTGVWE
jgi:hypothetical protein